MGKEVVLIFDIGKTNKKVLLFDRDLHILHEEETRFAEIPDDDGFAGDDIEKLEAWIFQTCDKYLKDEQYRVRGINFTTYGATLMYLNASGERLTPVYNYLKPMPEGVAEEIYAAFGGVDEFCRQTASPSLGMLNSGLQARWLQQTKPDVYRRVKHILHFPQYLSCLLTGEVVAEHTSIGCHTALWDFDHMQYHPWTEWLERPLPEPVDIETTFPDRRDGTGVPVGIGIHDSSASLVPYFQQSAGHFVLVSTGTWSIAMNPFNHAPLTAEELRQDCLAYMSIRREPVKSSRFFLGHIHDVNVEQLTRWFGEDADAYQHVRADPALIESLRKERGDDMVFFRKGMPDDYIDRGTGKEDFKDFREAYHQLMIDLTSLSAKAIRLIMSEDDQSECLYVTGGFSRNPLFLLLLKDHFPDQVIYTSGISNATSLGTAIVTWKSVEDDFSPPLNLGLKQVD